MRARRSRSMMLGKNAEGVGEMAEARTHPAGAWRRGAECLRPLFPVRPLTRPDDGMLEPRSRQRPLVFDPIRFASGAIASRSRRGEAGSVRWSLRRHAEDFAGDALALRLLLPLRGFLLRLCLLRHAALL